MGTMARLGPEPPDVPHSATSIVVVEVVVVVVVVTFVPVGAVVGGNG
jgi:hypothetical protein